MIRISQIITALAVAASLLASIGCLVQVHALATRVDMMAKRYDQHAAHIGVRRVSRLPGQASSDGGAPMRRPTKREVETVSDNPRRFRLCIEQADEVRVYAAGHRGALPSWAWKLTDEEWDGLAATMRELDALAWLRAA